MTTRGRRTWPQRLTLLTTGALTVALLITAGGLGYAYSKYSRLARVQLGSVLTEQESSSEPQNILLVGVDTAGSLDPDDPVRSGREDLAGLRSDTMMILRVDPDIEQAHLLSLPRDLWVPLASGGTQRINTAIEIGGPGELIATIEAYLGIAVNHYVQVDFAGFQELVDVVDGVDVWFEHPTRDAQSGLWIEETGCVSLGPEQALAYVRARHLQTWEEGRWRTDPTGDLGRMSRQQDFIIRALRRAADQGVRNPVTADDLVDAALDTVTVDDQLTADEMVGLAARFRSFRPDLLQTHALPVTDDTVGGAAVLRLVDITAQPILDLFRGTQRSEIDPSSVRVQVLNGSGRSGEAAAASEGLAGAGFTAVGTGEADTYGVTRTVVRYPAGQDQAADLVARHLVAGAVLEEVATSVGADVVVVTGADYAGVQATPTPSASSSTAPSPTTIASPPTANPAEPTTTTSVVGRVPMPPAGVSC